jgi:hypothetical protein
MTPEQLDLYRVQYRQRVTMMRDGEASANVTAHSRPWQSDKTSRELVGQALALAQAGAPLPPVWRDADNNDMAISTVADLVAIATAMAVQVQVAYATSWARKAAIDAATNLADMEAACAP